MTENEYITEVKRALLKEGYWGHPVSKLVEELRDHFRVKSAALEAQGHSQSVAGQMAANSLGQPQALAAEWIPVLRSRSWAARSPWLTGAMVFFGTCLLYGLFMVSFIYFYPAPDAPANPSFRMVAGPGADFLANWLPWIVGLLLLTWKGVRFPMGWKSLLVACLALGLATTAIDIKTFPPREGGGSEFLMISAETWVALLPCLVSASFHLDLPIEIWAKSFYSGDFLFKLFFPVVACLIARRMVNRSGPGLGNSRRKRYFYYAVLPAAILTLIIAGSAHPAILRHKMWLTIDVLTLSSSYAAFAMTAALGHLALTMSLWGRRYASAQVKVQFFLYRAMQIGISLLAAGMIVGGVWTYYAWGRMWDPKETWVLITLLCYIALLRGRLAGWWRGFGLSIGSVMCFLTVMVSWYAVNFILGPNGKSLHSYGLSYATSFIAIEVAFVALVLFSNRDRHWGELNGE